MGEFVAIALLGAVITKLVDFSKYVRNGDTNGALTQLYAWVVGVVSVILFVKSGLVDGLVLPYSEAPVDSYSAIAQGILGFAAASFGSVIFTDFKKSFDNTDSASTPNLF